MGLENKEAITAFWAEHERQVKIFQQERWERIRSAGTTLGVYTSLFDTNSFFKASRMMEIFNGVVLPLVLSDYLDGIIADTQDDGRERGTLIGWDARQRNFALGEIDIGSSSEVKLTTKGQHLNKRQRPLVDFHTHPSDGFFSPTDIRSALIIHNPAYVSMVGTRLGGYALFTTDKFQTKSFEEGDRFKQELDKNPYSWPENIARSLVSYGLIAYRWRKDPKRSAQGVGYCLTKL